MISIIASIIISAILLIGCGGGSVDNIVENFHSTSNVFSEWEMANIGGMIGAVNYANEFSKISHCYHTGNILGKGTVGGLIGTYAINYTQQDKFNKKYCEINNCYTTGVINCNSGNAGGLIGDVSSCLIKSCYSNTEVNCQYGGGLVGILMSHSCLLNCYATGNVSKVGNLRESDFIGGLVGAIGSSGESIVNCYSTGRIKGTFSVAGIGIGDAIIKNCYAGCSLIESVENAEESSVTRVRARASNDYYVYEQPITNCYANKNMTLTVNGVSTQPGLQNPLPDTVALDGANLPDNPDWKNDIFKDGYEDGESFDDVWEIGSSGLPILKNMPGNPVQ